MLRYLILILLVLFINTAYAVETSLSIKQEINRLQREVDDLNKTVYSGKKSNSKVSDQSKVSINLSSIDLRIYDLEKEIKNLNNKIENLDFKIDDLKNLYDEMNLNFNSELIINKNNLVQDNIKNIESDENSININTENTLGNLIISSEDLSDQNDNIVEDSINANTSNDTKEVILSPEDEFQIAFELLRSQKFNDAKYALNKFIDNHKDSTLSGSAHYWLGEIYLLKKEYREAALVLAEGYQKYPKSIKAPDMLYKLSKSLTFIDKVDDGCSTLNKLIIEYPNHKIINNANNLIAELNCDSISE